MFQIDPDLFDEESGESDQDKVEDYVDELLSQFAASPEAKPLLESEAGLGWAGMMLDYSLNHLGVPPARMSLADFNEVLFDLFPRKVSTEAENAPAIVEELKAFWQFLHRQFGLDNARRIESSLNPAAAERLRKKLADPANYGMAKSMFMLGKQAGFDMTTQKGTDQFILAYNSRLANNPLPPPLPLDDDGFDSLPLTSGGMTPKQCAERRKAKKRERQRANATGSSRAARTAADGRGRGDPAGACH